MGKYRKTFLPQEATGYELDSKGGMFSIVLNEATENIFTNPSAERNLVEFNSRQAALIIRTSEKQSKGTFSAKCTTSANVNDGIYKEKTFSSEGTYTFGVDVFGAEAVDYEIVITDNSFNPISRKPFRSLRKWVRPYITASLTAGTFRFCILQKTARAHSFYTDGWQLENKTYPTTYCDGDMEGYVIGENAYEWTGKVHNSSSTRSITTRSGGREFFLRDLNFLITQITGLGSAPISTFSKEIVSGGNFYIGANYAERPFTISGTMFASNGYIELFQNKKTLERMVDFSRTPFSQEILLLYRPSGDKMSIPYNVKCHYVSGLEGNINQEYRENVALQFAQSEPFMTNGITEASQINTRRIAAPPSSNGTFGSLLIKKDLRVVNIMSTGTSVVTNGTIYDAVFDKNNGIYVVGDFTTINGIPANRVAYWNGSTWAACGAGVGTGIAKAIIELPDGNFLIGGTFASGGGSTSKRYLTKYDPVSATYSVFGSPNNSVDDIFYLDGYAYVVGPFTNISGLGINYIARSGYTTASFSPCGTLAEAPSKVVGYKSGNTTYILVGIGGTTRSVLRTGDFSSWTTLYTVTNPGTINIYQIRDMDIVGASVYFVEWMNRDPGIDSSFVWKQNPSENSVVAYGDPYTNFRKVTAMKDGRVLFTHDAEYYSDSSRNNFIEYPSGYSIYGANKQYFPGEVAGNNPDSQIAFTGGSIVNVMVENKNIPGELFLSSRNAFSTMETVTNNGNTFAFPTFTFTGKANLYWIKNLTTNQYLYFNNLTIGESETVKVICSNSGTRVLSDVRGDISGYLYGGYSSTILLNQGDNNISTMMTKCAVGNIGLDLYLIGANDTNTNSGYLYLTFEDIGSSHRWLFYKDASRTQLVGQTDYYDYGIFNHNVYEQNSSGLAGWVREDASTAFVSPSPSLSPSASSSASLSPSRSASPSASVSISPSSSLSISPSRSASPSASQSRSPSPSLSPSRSLSPSSSPSPSPSATPAGTTYFTAKVGISIVTWIGQYSSITGVR
jgi:hypothetical protein